MSDLPQPGQTAHLRMRRWLVEKTDPATLGDDAAVVHLACLDDDAQGQQLSVLWEKEVDAEVHRDEGWETIGRRGFDEARKFAAFLHTLRWNCVTATDPKLFQAPFRAGIQILTYQLEPLRKALLLPRVNLFIADDVGLGKTIEAGLIARELLLRRKVDYIVVVAPPSVLPQWQEELEARFGLTFAVLDRDYLARIRAERGYATNPWTTHSRFLVSERLLVDDAYAGGLREHLGELRPRSLLIFDEAHHAAPASGAKYAIDSGITQAMRELAARFEHRLFLSATPHNGHSNSFSALLEILDPQRFCRGVKVNKGDLKSVLVRRLKDDVRELAGGFPKRETPQLDLDGLPADSPELLLARLLDDYRECRDERLRDAPRGQQRTSALLLSGLQQRLLSSVAAFARTLAVHRKTVERHWQAFEQSRRQATAPAALFTDDERPDGSMLLAERPLFALPLDAEDERATQDDAQTVAEEEAEVATATTATLGPIAAPTAQTQFARERELLAQMARIASANAHLPDARVRRLAAWIRENLLEPDGRRWKPTRLLIFTEFEDTRRYLVERLSEAIAATDDADARIAVFSGPTPEKRRRELRRAFNADPAKHPLRILVATDTAREGLNLQNHCFNLFHFDLPWNPSRLEQRNGRIDRKLQRAPTVYCHYFFYVQRPEDRVLQTLVRKTATIRRELGSLSNVLETRIEKRLRGGIRRRELEQQLRGIGGEEFDADTRKTVEEEFEDDQPTRLAALRGELDTLRNQLDRSAKWIHFDEAAFRDALSCSLELQNAPPMTELPDGTFRFPELDRATAANPTWRETLDTLRTPPEPDQKPWDWRNEAKVRPVIFSPSPDLDDSRVHLHLDHRVAQRLLGHFRAQGFVHHDLSRACLASSSDAIPRVLLLGRLSLYGPSAARLHEEVVAVAARWSDPADRARSPLKPHAEKKLEETLDLVEEALLQASQPIARAGVPAGVQQRLAGAMAQDVRELQPHLAARASELEAAARKLLTERADREARAMAQILADQKKRILAAEAKSDRDHFKPPAARQQFLPGVAERAAAEEKEAERQLRLNRKFWQKRLAAIDGESVTEPQRIRELYDVRAVRLEPVGLVYLHPVSG